MRASMLCWSAKRIQSKLLGNWKPFFYMLEVSIQFQLHKLNIDARLIMFSKSSLVLK
jgi:hypothetical protein